MDFPRADLQSDAMRDSQSEPEFPILAGRPHTKKAAILEIAAGSRSLRGGMLELANSGVIISADNNKNNSYFPLLVFDFFEVLIVPSRSRP